VFCGVLRVFRCFAGGLRWFASVLQYFHKTPEKHRKTLENTKNSQYARVLRAFSKSQKNRLYCRKHFSQNICKTPQNTAKQSQNAFCEITSQNTAKQTQNAQNCLFSKLSQNGRNTSAIRIARIRSVFT